MPVFAATSRRESPADPIRRDTSAAMAADVVGLCSIWSTVVPTWNTRKRNAGEVVTQFWYLSAPFRYFAGMSDNKREQSPWSDAVASQIRAERAAAGLTQAQMVELSGIPRSTYIRLEKGLRVADITQLARICGALKMSLSLFLARVEGRMLTAGQ